MAQTKKQIIAMGGGGFSMEPDNLLLDRYILKQSKQQTPRVCFLPTASGDSDHYIRRFYTAFSQLECRPTHLSLFRPPTNGITSVLNKQDIIYVGGGSTINMLTLWKVWKLDELLKEAWQTGTILCGLSAGSLCWFEEGLSDSVSPGEYRKIEGLGFIQGSHCPHYDGEQGRPPVYRQLINEQALSAGVAADDGVALHYVDNSLDTVVSSRPAAKAYRVSAQSVESIAPHYLGSASISADV